MRSFQQSRSPHITDMNVQAWANRPMNEINPRRLVPHEKVHRPGSNCMRMRTRGGSEEAPRREVITLWPFAVGAVIHMG